MILQVLSLNVYNSCSAADMMARNCTRGPAAEKLRSLKLLRVHGSRVVVVVVVDIDAQAVTPGEWQCSVRRLAVANGPNIFQMLLVNHVYKQWLAAERR